MARSFLLASLCLMSFLGMGFSAEDYYKILVRIFFPSRLPKTDAPARIRCGPLPPALHCRACPAAGLVRACRGVGLDSHGALVCVCCVVDAQWTQGVKRSASQSEIKKAWRKLSLDLHPDKNPRYAMIE